MRVTAKGTIEYQVEWSVGKPTWEPYDNILDDDLVDDFEAAEQQRVYGSADFKTGDAVEVKNVEEGFGNSWSAATVSKKVKAKYNVSYTAFVDSKGKAVTEDGVGRSRLRISPPAAKGWSPVVGEIVEAIEDDCWWEAAVEEVKGKSATLKFRVSDEVKKISVSKLRACSWLKLIGKK